MCFVFAGRRIGGTSALGLASSKAAETVHLFASARLDWSISSVYTRVCMCSAATRWEVSNSINCRDHVSLHGRARPAADAVAHFPGVLQNMLLQNKSCVRMQDFPSTLT